MLSAPPPFSLILFGASGHLAKLKIYPALYVLALKKRFPEKYAILGYARSEMDDEEFRKLVETSVRVSMGEVNERVLSEFLTHVHYQVGQYDQEKDFKDLAKKTETLEKGFGKDSVRMVYLSVPPTVFTNVLNLLTPSGIHKEGQPFRCIVEKPLGHDLKSFEAIRESLQCCFTEEEIYLLDHYLGKEAVRNIYYLRLANPVLERLFKNTLIRHVEVVAAESDGLEGRAGYFEETGTLRDMFQSHLLDICTLMTMRTPAPDESFRLYRRNALEQLYLPPAASIGELTTQGQYGPNPERNFPGYIQEDGIAEHSRTNTFVTLKLATRTSRWEGIPFYLLSGKRLDRKETRISIEFQVAHPVGLGSYPNRLDIILQGEAGLRLHLQTKLGGSEPQFRPLIMSDPLVCMGDCLPEHSLLLLEAIAGKQQWFLTFEEVRIAWRLIDPVQKYLEDPKTPLAIYPAGTAGPKEANDWIARDGLEWLKS